jgi:predicted small metal-binding protein
MGVKLACKDLDPDMACPFVAKGETMEELKADLFAHAKAVHNYTDEQLQDPKMLAEVNRLVKKE